MSPTTVLFFTNSEYGQANMNLATAYELALAGVDVHVASFAPLGSRVARLQEQVDQQSSRSDGKSPGSITFHEFKGTVSQRERVGQHGHTINTLVHPPGVQGAVESYSKLDAMGLPWSTQEYLAAIETSKDIILAVKPTIVAFMITVPNSIAEIALGLQPMMALLWKFPAMSSGFSFPLKWWQVPLNIYLGIRLIIAMLTAPNIKQVDAARKDLGLRPIHGGIHRGVTYICPSLTEIDLPYAVVPEQIRLCGPIVMPFDALEERDPALLKWLDNAPTVMINLGSHMTPDENFGKEIAGAIRMLLDYHDRKGSKIQLIWKSKANDDVRRVINEIIGKEIAQDKVRELAWLDAEPVSIQQHPNMVCTVHHGGANSFYEGIWSGMPHIILSVWYDTYDYATRVEYLGVGIYGNKTCAPGVRAEEFGKALVRITGTEALKYRTAANKLREVCRAKGNGRELAAMAILKEAGVS